MVICGGVMDGGAILCMSLEDEYNIASNFWPRGVKRRVTGR